MEFLMLKLCIIDEITIIVFHPSADWFRGTHRGVNHTFRFPLRNRSLTTPRAIVIPAVI